MCSKRLLQQVTTCNKNKKNKKVSRRQCHTLPMATMLVFWSHHSSEINGSSQHHQDQALSFWSGSTDSKTLDYQRTGVSNSENSHKGNHLNTRLGITEPSSCAGHLIQTTNKMKIQTQSSADRLPTHSALPIRGKKYTAQTSPYTKLTQTTGPNLGGQKPKGRKNSTLKPGKRRPQTQ